MKFGIPKQVHKFLQTGSSGQARWLGKQYGADFVLIGEAMGENFNTTVMGKHFVSADIQIEAKMISVSTGELLDTFSIEEKGIAKSRKLSREKRFQKCWRKISQTASGEFAKPMTEITTGC